MAETQTQEQETTKPATRTRSRAATTKKAEAPAAETSNRTVIELVPVGTTKTYSKWQAPEGSGCAGNFYAPLGVTGVRVAYVKP